MNAVDHGSELPTFRDRLISFRSMDPHLRILTGIVIAQVIATALLILMAGKSSHFSVPTADVGVMQIKSVPYFFARLFFVVSLLFFVHGLTKIDVRAAILLMAGIAVVYFLQLIASRPPVRLGTLLMIMVVYLFIFGLGWIAITKTVSAWLKDAPPALPFPVLVLFSPLMLAASVSFYYTVTNVLLFRPILFILLTPCVALYYTVLPWHFVLGQVHAQFFNCTEEAIGLVMVDSNGGDEIGIRNSRDMFRVKRDARENVLLLALRIRNGLLEKCCLFGGLRLRVLLCELKQMLRLLTPSPKELVQGKQPHLTDAVEGHHNIPDALFIEELAGCVKLKWPDNSDFDGSNVLRLHSQPNIIAQRNRAVPSKHAEVSWNVGVG